MKKITILFLILSVFSCKKDDDKIDEPKSTLLTSEIIGSEGGTIETEGISIDIPSGAFTSANEISIYFVEKANPYPNTGVSDVFHVDGIPIDYTKPLTFKIRYSGTLENESYIAAGRKIGIDFEGKEDFVHNYYSATDSSGFLVASIPAIESYTKNTKSTFSKYIDPEKLLLEIICLTYMKTTMSKNFNFEIKYPSSLDETVIDQLAGYLENSWAIFSEMGFNIEETELKTHIIKVNVNFKYIQQVPQWAPYGWIFTDVEEEGQRIIKDYNIFFLAEKLETTIDHEELKRDAGHVFFIRLAMCYRYEDPPWFDEAVASWTGEKFVSNSQNYIPPTLGTHCIMAPLYGWESNVRFNYADKNPFLIIYDDFFSPLIKYIVNWKGESIIPEIYEDYPDYSTSNLNEKLGEDFNEWFPFYIKNYVDGTLYKIDNSVFVDSIHNFLHVPSGDYITTHTDNYYDVSARLYRIYTGNSNAPENTSLKLSTSSSSISQDDILILTYEIDNSDNSIEFFKYGSTVVIPELTKLNDESKDIMAIVVNSSHHPELAYPRNKIDLNLALGDDMSAFTDAKITISYVIFDLSWQEKDNQFCQSTWTENVTIDPRTQNGIYDGTKYTAIWTDPEDYGIRTSGNVEIVFKDESYDEIVSFNIREYSKADGIKKKSYSIECTGAAMKKNEGSSTSTYLVFEQNGCSDITFNSYNLEHIYSTPCSVEVMESATCSEDATIKIEFYKH